MKNRFLILFIITSSLTGFSQHLPMPDELVGKLNKFPTIREFLVNATFDGKVKTDYQIAAYRFTDSVANEPVYVAWSKTSSQQILKLPKGIYWVMDTAQVVLSTPVQYKNVPVTATPVFILKAARQSPVINSIHVEGRPIAVSYTHLTLPTKRIV